MGFRLAQFTILAESFSPTAASVDPMLTDIPRIGIPSLWVVLVSLIYMLITKHHSAIHVLSAHNGQPFRVVESRWMLLHLLLHQLWEQAALTQLVDTKLLAFAATDTYSLHGFSLRSYRLFDYA